ncbi:MAG TPA: hypothetical protein VFB50_15960 [Chloroflexota bacterium]|nr:hypothetical protein [Chloroflexota bacterium]
MLNQMTSSSYIESRRGYAHVFADAVRLADDLRAMPAGALVELPICDLTSQAIRRLRNERRRPNTRPGSLDWTIIVEQPEAWGTF